MGRRLNLGIVLLIIASFIVRLIPHRMMVLVVYDEYLHRDITLRLVKEGIVSISKDPLSLLGLKPYSYPPLFHIIGALLYKAFHTSMLFYLLPAIYGTLAVIGFYYAFAEIAGNKRVALIAAAFLSFSPNFIYRTSLYIPENLGLFLFSMALYFLVKFLKGERAGLPYLIIVLSIYSMTHRGWLFFVIVAGILILSRYWDVVSRYLHILLIFAIIGYLAYNWLPVIKSTIGGLILRLQRSEVSFLGYFKWIGVVQLTLGVMATKRYLLKDPVRRGMAIWAWAFIFAGGMSFRFRDPYASIPLSLMASELLLYEIYPSISRYLTLLFSNVRGFGAGIFRSIPKKKHVSILLSGLIVVTPLIQGTYAALNYINPPAIVDKEAYQWIIKNTPENATILVWWDMGYLLIGNTHRRDVVIWKKVYQGFFTEAPETKEAKRAYMDHVIMFASNQRQRVYYLLKKYNVSYIFVDRIRLSYGFIKYGLMEYAPYDPHFRLEFCNGNSQIYRFIPDPPIKPNRIAPIVVNGTFSPLVSFLEKFWTGYNYADYDDSYKAYFNLNAWIARMYYELYKLSGNKDLEERYRWLLKWLAYKRMDDGSYPWGVPPNNYTLYTAYTLEPLKGLNVPGIEKSLEFLKLREREDYFMTTAKDKKGSLVIDALLLPIYKELSILNNDTEINVLNKLLQAQKDDGSWNENVGTTIAVASGLARYYQLTQNRAVLVSIKKAAQWLMENIEDDGRLKLEGVGYTYSRVTYAQLAFIFHVAGYYELRDLELKFIRETYDPNKEPRPLDSLVGIYRYVSYIYNYEQGLYFVNDLIKNHNLLKFSPI
ncbi:hypothetical protein [Pyrococcus kukulkanii]|uniref:hypothetical protein n=1 Tax=Pyrococcus kukulkanii TaxID=1609559 RepID=UPI003562ECB5